MRDQSQDVATRVARLSETQKAILRLVGRHLQSKEIAREMGVSRRTVDKHIATAMAHLGVSNRRDAVRMLAACEGERFPGASAPLSADMFSPPSPSPDIGDRWRGTIEFAEAQTPFTGMEPIGRPHRRFPFLGERKHDLTTKQRIGWMMALPFLIAFALGFFLIGFSALGELGRAIHRLFN